MDAAGFETDDPIREPSTPAVRCAGVTRQYRRGNRVGRSGTTVTALDDVSLSVGRGERVAVVGASGSGKSTLLHLVAALDTPTSGEVFVGDRETGGLSERRRARLRLEHVGVVFQRFYLLPSLSARANVALPLLERGVSRRQRRQRAESLLERVGLEDRLDHRPGELSGGEQQRVAVARALVNDPDVLVADEPTGELDSETGQRVLDLIVSSAKERAVIVASHDEKVRRAVDRVIELRDGRVVDAGE